MSRILADVVGDLDGDLDGDELAGYDVMGDLDGDVMGDEVVGVVKRNPRTGRMKVSPKPRGRMMQLPAKPQWRKEQMAPGVIRPDEGMVPLPLVPDSQSGIFLGSGGATQITWSGQLQKPYRAERLLVSVVRTSTTNTAVARLLGTLYVGTDLQQAEIAGWDIELIGQASSFGTRLTCQPAEPGVLIRLVVNLSQAFTNTADTIAANIMFLGRIIH